MHALMRKNTAFVWSEQQQQAFDQLKEKLTTAPILGIPNDEGTFYLDTDASDQGLGAVLSQIQNDSERVIAYASRALNCAERNYCTTRKELLAVVYGLKQFRQYLIGRQFIVRTDHSALQWLQRTPEPMAQQARWLAYIEQFRYTIQHRPGVRHGHADALSRRPQTCRNCSLCKKDDNKSESNSQQSKMNNTTCLAAAVKKQNVSPQIVTETEPDNMNLLQGEKLAAVQRDDNDIGCIVQWRLKQEVPPDISLLLAESEMTKILWSQWHRLIVKDGIVYRSVDLNKNSTPVLQLLVPKCMQHSMLLQCHTGMCGGHLGVKKTTEQVKRRAFWLGWRGDVKRFCRRCLQCNSYYRGKLPKSASLQPIIAGAPFERLSIDLTGPHVRSSRGSVYILTCADPFTKWVEAFPIPNKEAITVAKVLVEQVFCRFGVPVALLSDRGKEVDGRIMNEVCKLMDIDKMRTTSYKASTNAAIERFHRTLNGMLGRIISENQKDWDVWLPYVMAAYRSSQNEVTSYSPNYLMLGREVRAPVDIVLGTGYDQHMETTYDDFVEKLKSRLQTAYDIVRRQLGQAALRNKKYYDLRVKPMTYKVGDFVYYYNPRRTRGLQEKWQRKFTGPFEVVKLLGPVNILIRRTPRTRPFVVHLDKVKPFISNDETDDGSRSLIIADQDERQPECTLNENTAGACQSESSYDPYGVNLLAVQRPRRNVRRPSRFDD
jgi:RNase H-like domain found in reverse transcriptase/Integrase zinc binding domain/Integrase core domain